MGLVETPQPAQSTEPMHGYTIQVVHTVDVEGQHLGHSAVALRDVYEHGIPVESDISESYAMELARFEKADDAEQYTAALTQYIKERDGLEFVGSPENMAGTQTFLNSVAENNGLQTVEQVVEREIILQQGTFLPEHDKNVQPIRFLSEPGFTDVDI